MPGELEFKELGADPRPQSIEEPAYDFRSNKLSMDELEHDAADTRRMTRKQAERHRQKNTNLKLTFVTDIARDELEEQRLWKDLCWYVPFLIFFIFFLLARRDTEGFFWNQKAVGTKAATEEMLNPFWGKTFLDIANQEDWQDWVSQVFVPLYWPEGEDAPSAATNVVMGNNIKVGAARVRTVRMENTSCTMNSKFVETNETLFPQTCFSDYKKNELDNARDEFGDFPPVECKNEFFMSVEGKVRDWGCHGNILDVPFADSSAVATTKITNDAVANFFANSKHSRFVMVEFMHYNPTLDIFTLSQNWVEITAGGAYFPQTRTIFFEVITENQKGVQAYTVVFFLVVLTMIGRFLYQLASACSKGEGGPFIFSVWNILEAFNLSIFIFMISFRFAWWAKCSDLDFKLPNDGPAPFNEELHYIAGLYDMSIFLNGVNTVIMFLKILRFAPLNRRLRIVTRSIVRAQQNIVGLMVLFVVVLLAFSITGMALFGTGIEDFRNLEVSFSTLLRILLGDFAYDELREENLFLAGLFFWAYLILGLFLLLNFIIAVIGNAFGQENADLIAEPMDKQLQYLFNSIRRSVERFFDSPASWFHDMLEVRKESWAKESKYELLRRELTDYRASLPIEGIPMEEFLELPESEREEFMPDPYLNRNGMNDIFNSIEEGPEKLRYLGEVFLDEFWITSVHEQLLHDNHKNKAVVKRKKAMTNCAEKQLRGVLGLGGGEVVAEAMSVRELLEPSEQSLAHLAALEDRIGKIEGTTDKMGETFCKLNAMLNTVFDAKSGKSSVEQEEEVVDVRSVPRQKPKSKLTDPSFLPNLPKF